MGLKDETPTRFALRTVDANDDRGVRMLFGEPGTTWMLLYGSPVHVETIQRQAFIPERTKHEVLNCMLCAANRPEANEGFGKLYLFGEAFVDRSDQPQA